MNVSEGSKRAGTAFAIGAAFCAASAYLFASAAVRRMDPSMLGVLEFSIATVPAFLWALSEGAFEELRYMTSVTWGKLGLQAVFTFGAIFTLWTGLQLVDPTTASLLNRVEVVFTVILGILLFTERHHPLELLGGLVAFGGVLFMRWNAPPELSRGTLWILGSALCFAGAELTAKWLAPELRSSAFLLLRTPLMALLFLSYTLGRIARTGMAPELPDARGLALAAGVALCGPILARAFYYSALRRIALSRAALLNQTQPLFVAALAAGLYGTLPGSRQILGGLLILGGSCLLIYTRFRILRRAAAAAKASAELL